MTIAINYGLSATKPAFTTNTYTTGDQLQPDVLGLDTGGFVSTYNNSPVSDGHILLNFYDAQRHVIGSFEAPYGGDTSAAGQPRLAQLANGNVLVVWDDDGNAYGKAGIQGRILTRTGEAVGSPATLQLSDPGHTQYVDVSVAALTNGNFVVTYGLVSGAVIYSQIFMADGQPFAQKQPVAASNEMSDPQVTGLSTGGYVMTWTDKSGSEALINARVYNGAGDAQGTAFSIGVSGDNTQSSIAAMSNGRFAVAYADTGWGGAEGTSNGITLQIYDQSGQNQTPDGFIHVNVPGPQEEYDPSVTILDNGFIAVTWTRLFSANDGDIYGRIFDGQGHEINLGGGAPFVITSGSGNDVKSAVSSLLGGEFITSWQNSAGQDGSGGEVTSTIEELVRYVTGDSGADTFTGDSLRDNLSGGAGSDTLNGAAGNDTINGGADGNVLDGGNGADLINAGFNADTVHGGSGNDRIYAMASDNKGGSIDNDTLYGDAGNDHVTGSGGGDRIDGGDGQDNLLGLGASDSMFGGTGDDKIFGGAGADRIEGGAGSDVLNGGDGADILVGASMANPAGSSNADVLNGGIGDDTLIGSNGGDKLYGASEQDKLIGGASDDRLDAGKGKDVLIGGLGQDTLIGGSGVDTFVYASLSESCPNSADVIMDLEKGDRINLYGIDADTVKAGNQAFHLVSSFSHHRGELVVAFHAQDGGYTTIQGDVDGDGVADLAVVAIGDHHDFGGFVL